MSQRLAIIRDAAVELEEERNERHGSDGLGHTEVGTGLLLRSAIHCLSSNDYNCSSIPAYSDGSGNHISCMTEDALMYACISHVKGKW